MFGDRVHGRTERRALAMRAELRLDDGRVTSRVRLGKQRLGHDMPGRTRPGLPSERLRLRGAEREVLPRERLPANRGRKYVRTD